MNWILIFFKGVGIISVKESNTNNTLPQRCSADNGPAPLPQPDPNEASNNATPDPNEASNNYYKNQNDENTYECITTDVSNRYNYDHLKNNQENEDLEINANQILPIQPENNNGNGLKSAIVDLKLVKIKT